MASHFLVPVQIDLQGKTEVGACDVVVTGLTIEGAEVTADNSVCLSDVCAKSHPFPAS